MDEIDTRDKIETYFKQVNCLGKFNYCFTSATVASMKIGMMETLTWVNPNVNLIGYLLNQNEK